MKRFLTSMLCLLIIGSVATKADKVSVDDARQKAAAFISQHATNAGAKGAAMNNKTLTLAYTAANQSLYVFNVAGGGFVITAGDDCACPVLGYNETGLFGYDNAPDAMKNMLAKYENQIASASAKGVKYNAEEDVKYHAVIDTMVTTKWGQESPFNILCPTYTSYNGEKHCYTGCGATSLSQLLKYRKWPEHGYGVAVDTHGTDTMTRDLSNHYYNWDVMLDSYVGNTNAEADTAVALLMVDMGYAMNSNYQSTGTGIEPEAIPYALVQHFGYDQGLRMEDSQWYNAEEWDNLVYTEMAENGPMYFSGDQADTNIGHAFLLDGYDGKGFYHVNWGWSGESNGYYRLTALTPSVVGKGSVYNSNGYNGEQYAIVGFKKPCGGVAATSILQKTNLFFEEKDGHTCIIPKIWSYSSFKLEKVGIIAKITNKATNAVSYFPLSYDETLMPADNNANCTQPFDLEDITLADGNYSIELRYRTGYANDAAIEESQLSELRHGLDYISSLDFSVADGVKTFSVPEEATADYAVSISEADTFSPITDGDDFECKTSVTNNGFPMPISLVAKIVYTDENDEFHVLYTSDVQTITAQHNEKVKQIFTITGTSYDLVSQYSNVAAIVTDETGKIYASVNLSVSPRLFTVDEPVVCDQVHDGKITVDDINGGVSLSGKFTAVKDFSAFLMEGVMLDTETRARVTFKPASTTFATGDVLNMADVEGVHNGTLFDVGSTVKFTFRYIIMFPYASDDLVKPQEFTVVASPTAIKNVTDNVDNAGVKKIIKDGKVVIVNGDKEYTTAGQQIK